MNSLDILKKSIDILSPKFGTLSQAAIQQRYGIEKSFLRQILNNQFYIPEIFHETLQHYRLCTVSGTEFSTRIREGTLTQHVNGKPMEFAVIYSHCSPSIVRRAHTVRMSFRAAKAEIGLEPVVIVTVPT